MSEFLAMGGYGAYVWSAFGITFAVLLFNVLLPMMHHQSAWKEAQLYFEMKQVEKQEKMAKQANAVLGESVDASGQDERREG